MNHGADHLVHAPHRKHKCTCGEPASRFMRCRVARCLLAWCANCVPRNVDDARRDHERAHNP